MPGSDRTNEEVIGSDHLSLQVSVALGPQLSEFGVATFPPLVELIHVRDSSVWFKGVERQTYAEDTKGGVTLEATGRHTICLSPSPRLGGSTDLRGTVSIPSGDHGIP